MVAQLGNGTLSPREPLSPVFDPVFSPLPLHGADHVLPTKIIQMSMLRRSPRTTFSLRIAESTLHKCVILATRQVVPMWSTISPLSGRQIETRASTRVMLLCGPRCAPPHRPTFASRVPQEVQLRKSARQ